MRLNSEADFQQSHCSVNQPRHLRTPDSRKYSPLEEAKRAGITCSHHQIRNVTPQVSLAAFNFIPPRLKVRRSQVSTSILSIQRCHGPGTDIRFSWPRNLVWKYILNFPWRESPTSIVDPAITVQLMAFASMARRLVWQSSRTHP